MASKRFERLLDVADFRFREADEAAESAAANGGKPITLSGYASKFDDPTVLSSDGKSKVIEVIRPGAFKNAIAEQQDVRCLVDHNPTLLLGRTRSGTLKLWEDEIGLAFEVELPDIQLARDLTTSIRRRDLTQCSFSFAPRPGGENVEKRSEDGVLVTRVELTDVDLFDVSVVTYPAYPGTTVSVEARCKAIASNCPTRSGRVVRRNLRKAAALRVADHILSKRGR